ncbi:MAG: aryl-alcohol dehydrogenase [Betaproteobacteria bacterium]|nr:aryl-alcohol dehydrogenase [Betaproteobacteria bacterium]
MRLGLGTVQFGIPYGISNVHGTPNDAELASILEAAAAAGINLIDTAHAYGECEKRLGRLLPREHEFRIVTKTVPVGTRRITADDAIRVRDGFFQSLSDLRQTSVYGLLVHRAEDLLAAEGGRLMDALLELKGRRLVHKIGVSFYDQNELDAVLERYSIDIAQVPVNVLDQRLVSSGALARMKCKTIEIHARSVFLQGLLLMEPDGLDAYFQPARGALRRFRAFAEECSLTPVQAAMRFVTGLAEVDAVIVGVTRREELEEVVTAFRAAAGTKNEYTSFALDDDAILNPARWPH